MKSWNRASIEKGEALMKNALIRFLTLISLGMSLTGFAAAGESKRHDAAASAMQQQSGCASATEQGKKQKKEKETGDRSGQEQEFDRVLMGIYG
jgi:hypothetical protein